ncbi:MAG TPA: nucleotide exchange factor GrpE [Candidatus Acidoferrales bacterium]|nr:nucleotide exchange factor GrpE [Candidatus Acidoferrales bacterium]
MTSNPPEKPTESPKKPRTDVSSHPGNLPDNQAEQLRAQLKEANKLKQESEKKAEEYLDRAKRLQADMENLQKITKRQIESITRQAAERLMVKLLPSIDALKEAERLASSEKSLPREEVAVGLKMLQQQLSDVLRSEGFEEIAAVGQKLDPEKHEVVSYVETDEKPENTILEEIRKGYTLNGRVIRPSIVVVSKKPHSNEEPAEADAV